MQAAVRLLNLGKARRGKPTFSMAKVEEDPKRGFLAKWICSRSTIDFTYFPQLGLPKIDVDDPVPQFDEQRKIRYTFSVPLLANIIAVSKGYIDVAAEETREKSFRFTKELDEYCVRIISDNTLTGEREVERKIVFCGVYATGLEHFLASALDWTIEM